MRIGVRERGEVTVVDISVAAAGDAAQVTLLQRLDHLLHEGQTEFILNLTRGPVLGSAWLGELVACRERVQKHHGAIKLVLTPRQSDVVAAGKLGSLFETFRDEEDALDSFVPWFATNGIP